MTAGLLLLWFNETILIAPGSHCAVYFCLSREISHYVLHMPHDADSFSSYVYKHHSKLICSASLGSCCATKNLFADL